MCGKEMDFDPDALVQNAVYALCGPYTKATAVEDPRDKVIELCAEELSAHASWCEGCCSAIAAIEQLSWSEAQLKVIREQMTWAVGFREVAGGYYTTRHMTNAVRKVTNDKTDPRETLLDYARTINEEINKKRLEFGLPIDEETP